MDGCMAWHGMGGWRDGWVGGVEVQRIYPSGRDAPGGGAPRCRAGACRRGGSGARTRRHGSRAGQRLAGPEGSRCGRAACGRPVRGVHARCMHGAYTAHACTAHACSVAAPRCLAMACGGTILSLGVAASLAAWRGGASGGSRAPTPRPRSAPPPPPCRRTCYWPRGSIATAPAAPPGEG
eukprot:scaffold82390_cov54-Phaeocystis_antarctica.AAC.2